jgi:WD40 repeat protein
VASSGQVTAASALPFAVGSLAWSQDGATVFAGASAHLGDESEVGGLASLDAATGQIRWRIDEGRISAIAVHPDGNRVAVGSMFGPTFGESFATALFGGSAASSSSRVRLLDATSGEPLWEVASLAASELVFSPDGRHLAVNERGHIHLLDATSGAERHDLGGGSSPFVWVRLGFNSDSTRLVTANGSRVVVFDTATGREQASAELSKRIVRVAFSEDGQGVVVVCDEDATVSVLDPASGAIRSTAHLEGAHHVRMGLWFFAKTTPPIAVSRDGRRIAANCSHGFGVFRSDDGRSAFEARRIGLPFEPTSMVFSPGGRQVAVMGMPDRHNPPLFVVDAESGATWWQDDDDNVLGLAFGPDGRRLAAGGKAAEGGYVRVYETDPERARCLHGAAVVGIAVTTGGLRLVGSASADQKASLFDADTGMLKMERPHPPVRSIAFTPGGQRFLTGSANGEVRMYETVSGHRPWVVTHGDAVLMIAVSPHTGEWIATASRDKTARALRTVTGEEIWRHPHPQSVSHIAVSADESRVATGCFDQRTRVLDAATGKEKHQVRHDGKVRALAFAPTSSILASANEDGTVTVLDASTGEQLGQVVHSQAASAVAISRELAGGQVSLMATAGQEKTVRIFTMASGAPMLLDQLPVAAPVRLLAFHPAAQLLAILEEGASIKVIDPLDGVEYARLIHPAPVNAMTFSADGELIVTACDDRLVRVFTMRMERHT